VTLRIARSAGSAWLLGLPVGQWPVRAVVLLVAAAPCALVMSMPVAIAAGITAAGRCGILIKGGVHPRTPLPNQIRSDTVIGMKTLSVTEVARNFREVLDSVEHEQEEIVLVRNRKQVARLVPEAPCQNALEVFGDLYRTLDDQTAEALSAAVSAGRKGRRGRVSELRNPWAG